MYKDPERLVQDNLPLINKAIVTYVKGLESDGSYGPYTYGDLFQYGAETLCRCARLYDSSKGKFSTYAVNAIRNTLYRVLSEVKASDILLDEEALEILEENQALEAWLDVEADDDEKFYYDRLDAISKKYSESIQKGIKAILLQSKGLSYQEISTKLAIPVKHIATMISRAQNKLRNDKEVLMLFGK